MNDLDLQRHQPSIEGMGGTGIESKYWNGPCRICGGTWPCDASRALVALDEADETLTGPKSKAYAAYQSACARADAAEAIVAMLVGNLRCDDCAGQGWYADGPTDSPEQVQCARCSGTGWALGEDFALVLRDDPTLSAAAVAHDARMAEAAVEVEREKWREADNAVALAAEYVANDWHWDDDDPNRVVLHDTLAEDLVTLRKVVDQDADSRPGCLRLLP
jgi:hypothetical protein